MGIDIALYLIRDGTPLHGVVPQEKIDGGEFVLVPARDGAIFSPPSFCYLRQSPPRPTPWRPWIEEVFDFGNTPPETQSSGCLTVFETSGRVFALAFGSGRYGIEGTLIEHDFGLRVALNLVEPDQLRRLVSKTVDLRTREKSTYHHSGGPVGEFAMDLDVEWLRTVAGSAEPGEEFSAVAGAEAIRIRNYKRPISQIPDLCTRLLAAYGAAIPEAFAFAENLRPISKRSPKHAQLEQAFQARVDSGQRDNLEVIVDWGIMDRLHTARLFVRSEEIGLDDLSSTVVWQAVEELTALVENLSVSRIKIEIRDEHGEPIVSRSFLDVVQAEMLQGGDAYLRIERRWFAVSKSYIDEVDRRILDLPSATNRLKLPIWNKTTHPREEDYNRYVANQKGWLLQDQKFLYPSTGTRVEPCDLMTETADFIHIKEGKSSAQLNHLWGQLSSSAELYAKHARSRTNMRRRYGTKWKTKPLAKRRPTFVAAVGRKNVVKDLLGRMLIAKITLLDHVRRVRALNFNFELAGFKITE